MHDGVCLRRSGSVEKEEYLSCMPDLAEGLLALCSSSTPCEAEKLISVRHREKADPMTCAELVSGVADCEKITNLTCKWFLLRAEFKRGFDYWGLGGVV